MSAILNMRTILRECCRVYTDLPCASTSTITGNGIRNFRRRGAANHVTIYPRTRDGACAAYVCPDDVQLIVTDKDHEQVHALDAVSAITVSAVRSVVRNCGATLSVIIHVSHAPAASFWGLRPKPPIRLRRAIAFP